MLNVAKELAAMERMTIDQLRARYAEVFGEPTRSRHKEYLIKRIIWRLQANAEGGLSERAMRRAAELANIADLRVTAPRAPQKSPEPEPRTTTVAVGMGTNRELMPGTSLTRLYKGRAVSVLVTPDGFVHEGERYKSLTAVTKAVTGKHWNGFHFFGLRDSGGNP